MLRASIFQQNVLNNSEKSEQVKKIQNCLVDLNDNKIVIMDEDYLILESELCEVESDFHTVTYNGNFHDNESFRLIRPIGQALENIKNEYNCHSAFTIGSINPSGYAIHFILTEENDIRKNNIVEKGKKEQIDRLLQGILLAVQNQLYQNSFDFSKRLLSLIHNGSELLEYKYGREVLVIMKATLELYTTEEKEKISR